ncbi:MAG: type II toxin-antitoxin system RatA family toxin, partial [Myxococcota bacterium]
VVGAPGVLLLSLWWGQRGAAAELGPALQFSSTAPPEVIRQVAPRGEAATATIKGMRATFLVHATKERVLATLWDVERFQEIFPDFRRVEVIERGNNRVDARFFVDVPLATVTYDLRRELDLAEGQISWREIGGDLRAVRGGWRVEPTDHPDLVRVTYESFVDVGRFVPEALVRDLAIAKLEEVATRVRLAAAASAPPSDPR